MRNAQLVIDDVPLEPIDPPFITPGFRYYDLDAVPHHRRRPWTIGKMLFAAIHEPGWAVRPEGANHQRRENPPGECQKRKRNPAVVATLLRARKPLASPPLSEVDMMPR